MRIRASPAMWPRTRATCRVASWRPRSCTTSSRSASSRCSTARARRSSASQEMELLGLFAHQASIAVDLLQRAREGRARCSGTPRRAGGRRAARCVDRRARGRSARRRRQATARSRRHARGAKEFVDAEGPGRLHIPPGPGNASRCLELARAELARAELTRAELAGAMRLDVRLVVLGRLSVGVELTWAELTWAELDEAREPRRPLRPCGCRPPFRLPPLRGSTTLPNKTGERADIFPAPREFDKARFDATTGLKCSRTWRGQAR